MSPFLWFLLICIAFSAGMASPKQLTFTIADRKPVKRVGRPAGSKKSAPKKPAEKMQEQQGNLHLNPSSQV